MPIKIGLIGKTNTGKTTFFNSATLSSDDNVDELKNVVLPVFVLPIKPIFIGMNKKRVQIIYLYCLGLLYF